MDSFEGFSNQSKTDGMVNNHLSSCNSHQFSFELQTACRHYEKNSIKLTTFGFYVHTIRDTILEGEKFGEFGKFVLIHQNFLCPIFNLVP